MNWYLGVLKKYAVFNGRARRKEYWYFVLFNFIACIILTAIDVLTGTYSAQTHMGLLGSVYTLAVLLPSIAVGVRRLHDTGRSGWWLFLALIPVAGLALLVFFLLDSKPGENQYGPSPKGT